jgi:hypothetical protein
MPLQRFNGKRGRDLKLWFRRTGQVVDRLNVVLAMGDVQRRRAVEEAIRAGIRMV